MAAGAKSILFLGAAHFQLPPIQYARERGYRIVTCDNRPQNPGHELADRSYEVSTVDCEGVLALARREEVDGVLAFASDVSAPTAAFVAARLGLPGNPPEAVERLTRKDLFRELLAATGLQPMLHRRFERAEREAIPAFVAAAAREMMIKPVDGSGSKGVAVLSPGRLGPDLVPAAVDAAFARSRCGAVIVEERVARTGRQVCGDGYVEDGRLAFVDFGDGHFHDDDERLAPFGETFPSSHPPAVLARAAASVDPILAAAGFCRGPVNLDVLITPGGEPFVLEIGPRAGGNFLPTAISLRTGVDLVAAAVESCLDPGYRLPARLPARPAESAGNVACYMVHGHTPGVFHGVTLSAELRRDLVLETLYLQPGAPFAPFTNAGDALGCLVLRFESFAEMQAMMGDIEAHCRLRWSPSPSD